MTEKKLKERVKWSWCGYGTYNVSITYRGKDYHCKSHNTLANDDYQEEGHRSFYKTDKQCLLAFYNECKRKNNLGEYNY